MSDRSAKLELAAWDTIRRSARSFGFVATGQDKDNYARLWSRDSAITALAVLAHRKEEFYPAVEQSIENLLAAVGAHGVFPSNVKFDKEGNTLEVSYGGPVGRTDSPFWWAIMALSYLEVVDRPHLRSRVEHQLEIIEDRAHAWEFNNKHLMYAPTSSNWADEYPVEGYILLNNTLRFWMLQKAGRVFNHNGYRKKAVHILLSIKSHFFCEPAESMSLFTPAQLKRLDQYQGGDRLLMSFTPNAVNNTIDALGWSVSFLLGAASKVTMNKALERWNQSPFGQGYVNAHWPIIEPGQPGWESIENNYAYEFKNHPGAFHNGGIWGLTQGFATAMLFELGHPAQAQMDAFESLLHSSEDRHPMAEYYHYPTLEPGGVQDLCFTASGYLLSRAAQEKKEGFKRVFERPVEMNREMVVRIGRNIAEQLWAQAPARVYRICGESGCGKTTLAHALVQVLEAQGKRVMLLSQDDFFHLPPRQNHNKRVEDFDWIGPQEVDFELLNGCLDSALAGRESTQKLPVMNWERDEKEWVESANTDIDVIVVEGTYVLSELRDGEVGVFFQQTYEDTREARIARNREVVDDFIQRVLEREHALIAPLGQRAQFHIDKQYQLLKNTKR